jgi:hypothetical protein
MARVAIGVLTLAVGAAALALSNARSCAAHISARQSAPSLTNAAWRWAAAAPGMNIYIADSGMPAAARLTSVWVDRRYLGSAAGIDKNLIELRELDCVRKLTRRKSPVTGEPLSEWTELASDVADLQVLASACATRSYSGAARRQGAWPADTSRSAPPAIATRDSAFAASRR